MGKYFGTDGFRGEANVNLTVEHAYQVGRYLGWYFGREHKAKIVIGKDTRRSSYMFEYSLAAGLTASGADAYLLHVTTTPSVSYVVRTEGFDCGIMISASHNPYYDNGIKVINGLGQKLEASVEQEIEEYMDGLRPELPLAKREKIGRTVDFAAGRSRYIGHLLSIPSRSYSNMKVGLDCSNGSASSIAKGVFDALGARTSVIHNEPNGLNINEKCGSTHLTRDPDVLDTWFSSALWPFSTLGWPEQTADLDFYYPTSVMVTGYDIIFFWVARMIFSGCEHTGKPPFHTVFIHGLVRDDKGRKMSKSLGNGIDPLEMATMYGADALRFNLITGNSPGNDTRFYTEKCEAMRNFANKIWNASRFVMMNLTIDKCELPAADALAPEDKWVLSKLNTLVKEVTENLDAYEIGVASAKVYDFLWDTYCDWYIELTKTRLQGEDEDSKIRAQQVLCYVLTETLKLLHPFMPFITEEIWQALPHQGDYLMLQQWPEHRAGLDFPEEEKAMELIMDAIRGVRARRAEMNVPPSKKAQLTVSTLERDVFTQGIPFLKRLAYASDVTVVGVADAGSDEAMTAQGMVTVTTHAARIFMPLAELVDLEKEKARIQKELDKNRKELDKLETKLRNPGFVNKAPAQVVEAEKERAEKLRALIAKLEESAAALA